MVRVVAAKVVRKSKLGCPQIETRTTPKMRTENANDPRIPGGLVAEVTTNCSNFWARSARRSNTPPSHPWDTAVCLGVVHFRRLAGAPGQPLDANATCENKDPAIASLWHFLLESCWEAPSHPLGKLPGSCPSPGKLPGSSLLSPRVPNTG